MSKILVLGRTPHYEDDSKMGTLRENRVDDAAGKTKLNPSQAQIDAGNYAKGHVMIQGLNISIENPKGSQRSGVCDGKTWTSTLPEHYGYIKRTSGADGEQVDCFIGPNPKSNLVWVVNQQDADTQQFDEHKVMLGFDSSDAAIAAYKKAFADGRGEDRIQDAIKTTIPELKAWLEGLKPLKESFAGHAGRPGERGGSQPRDGESQPYVRVTVKGKAPVYLKDAVTQKLANGRVISGLQVDKEGAIKGKFGKGKDGGGTHTVQRHIIDLAIATVTPMRMNNTYGELEAVPESQRESFYGHAGVPGHRGGSAPRGDVSTNDLASKVAITTKGEGGVTISTHGNVPKSGFVVGGGSDAGTKAEQVFPVADLKTEDIESFITNHINELMKPAHFVGAWLEGDNAYLDISTVLSDRKSALSLAHERDEKAIYDIRSGDSVYTMSDQQRPSTSSGTRITESAAQPTKILIFGQGLSAAQILQKIKDAHSSKGD